MNKCLNAKVRLRKNRYDWPTFLFKSLPKYFQSEVEQWLLEFDDYLLKTKSNNLNFSIIHLWPCFILDSCHTWGLQLLSLTWGCRVNIRATFATLVRRHQLTFCCHVTFVVSGKITDVISAELHMLQGTYNQGNSASTSEITFLGAAWFFITWAIEILGRSTFLNLWP